MAKKQKCVSSADVLKNIDAALVALEKSIKHAENQAKCDRQAIAALLELEAQIEDAKPCRIKKKKKKKKANLKQKSNSETLPNTLVGARDGEPDDLELIAGVGPKLAETLNSLGVYHYNQIASWQDEQIEWFDTHLNFPGRIVRENWVEQAKALATGGRDEYVKVFGKEPR